MSECPHCGAKVKMIAGLKCPKCGHTAGLQNLEHDWSAFDSELGRTRAKGADAQTRPYRGDSPRRRYPLDFKMD